MPPPLDGGENMAELELVQENGQTDKVTLYRCTFCLRLLTTKLIENGTCAGHRITEYVELNQWEKEKLEKGEIT